MNDSTSSLFVAFTAFVFGIGLMLGWNGAINRYYFGGLEMVCEPPIATFSRHCRALDPDEIVKKVKMPATEKGEA